MMIKIDDKSYSLKLFRVNTANIEKAKELARELGGLLFGLDDTEHESIFPVAFYNACVRWHFGEAISRRFEYEFLVCLTGKTQLAPLLKNMFDYATKKAIYLALINSEVEDIRKFNVGFEELNLESVALGADHMSVIVGINQQLLMRVD